jgi:hypothetical protein
VILFRTCKIASNSPALRFIKRAKNISTIVKLLGTRDMIEDVFKRPLPLSKQFESRFGPEGLNKNVFYTSEKKDTTLYEYGFHLLTDPSLLNKPIYASTYNVELIASGRPLDVTQIKDNAHILSRTSYAEAHTWIRSLDAKSLDVIRYPNVRDPNPGGFNFAIFNRPSVQETGQGPDPLILTTLSGNRVKVQHSDDTEQEISPIIT